jgi:putative membrane protein
VLESLPHCDFNPVLIGALALLASIQLKYAQDPRARSCALYGWWIAAAALISPLSALSVSLFAARILQQMILVLIAAPLIARAWPLAVIDPERSRSVWPMWLSAGAFFVALWFWHMPGAYDATLSSPYLYWTMQGTLFGSSILLWRELLQHRAEQTGDILAVGVLSSMQMSLLGVVLVLAPWPLFFSHLTTTAAWGFTPLQDQQLGGALIWVPGMLLFVWAALRSLKRLWDNLEELKST